MKTARIVTILGAILLGLGGPVAAQDTGVRDAGAIGDFRLDQPVGPTDPDRPATTTPRVPATQPQFRPQTPPQTQAQPQVQAQPQTPTRTTIPRAATSQPAADPQRRPASVATDATALEREIAPNEEEAAQDAAARGDTNARDQSAAPDNATDTLTASEAEGELPDENAATAADGLETNAGPALSPEASAPETGPDWGVIAPYLLGAAALVLGLFWFTRRKRSAEAEPIVAAKPMAKAAPERQPIATPAPATPAPATPSPAPTMPPAPRPSAGTIGIAIGTPRPSLSPAPVPAPLPAPAPKPSLAEQGFITTRAAQPAPPAPTAAPKGTIGIPLSRVAPPAPAPAPAPTVQLSEGTRLIARLTAEEMIRDADGLRMRFNLTIANLGMMTARDVALRTVLITAAPDSDRAVANWLANPTGQAAATIEAIDSGTQTQVTGDIQLSADQIRAMRHGGEAVFVPMMAVALDFVGGEGLDRTGDAFIIGQTGPKAANGIAAPVLPLPHDGESPRRWTDLAQRPAGLGALAKV